MTHRTAAPPDPPEVRSASGLVYRVIPATSYDARLARDVRQLAMDDGRVWTVGTRGRGSALAWRACSGGGDCVCPCRRAELEQVRRGRVSRHPVGA